MYQARYLSRSEFFPIRGLQYHVRTWRTGAFAQDQSLQPGPEQIIVMAHGWMDVSASFQFVVDALQGDWVVHALDWRGFGLTSTPAYDTYWVADYTADLDQVLDALQLQSVNLLGHSMGGNTVMLYAGLRPERIRRLINLEGTGMPTTKPGQIVKRYRQFLDDMKSGARMRPYPNIAEVAERLMKTNPRLAREKAEYLAPLWSRQNAQGLWEIQGDPAHKLSSPTLYKVEEVMAIWRCISAPVLLALAGETDAWHEFIKTPAYRRRLMAISNLRLEEIAGAGHMMHHDQPQVIAQMVETFIK